MAATRSLAAPTTSNTPPHISKRRHITPSPTPASRPTSAFLSVHSQEPHAIILTALPLITSRPALGESLRAERCDLRVMRRWEELLEAIERHPPDAVLVDLDDVDRSRRDHLFGMSGHRLVSLLARVSAQHRSALLVQTALDFAEVQDLVRLGAHALIHPALADDQVSSHIHTALARMRPASDSAPSHHLAVSLALPSPPHTLWLPWLPAIEPIPMVDGALSEPHADVDLRDGGRLDGLTWRHRTGMLYVSPASSW
jgi:AmiR/NasT family two-component response regulator